jgi:NAD(P)-dependent dehydrogenase (short-subunit alcohol dehydrogenase family)
MNMSKQKIAFITGANRGIGFETARELAEKGIRVIIGARNAADGDTAAKKLKDKKLPADFIQFDVNNYADHKKAAKYFEEKFGRLDILINNAGVMKDAQDASGSRAANASTVSIDIVKNTFETNFFAPVALTQTLLPLIRKSEAGRIVNLSSILASLELHSNPKSPIYDSKLFAYNSSKTALNAFTVHLAHELKDTNIKVNSAHPGWVKTEMGGPNATMELAEGGKTSVQLALSSADGTTGSFVHLNQPLPW